LAPSDRWYYIALLSLKSQGVLDQFRGNKLDRVVCAKLRLTQAEWEECARRLQEEDLITSKYQPIGWEGRQFTSDSSAERVRRHRAKKGECNGDVTLHETGNVTTMKRYNGVTVTPPDTDTDTDQIQKTPIAAAIAAGAALPVDNFSLLDLGRIYNNPDSESEIFNHGVPLLVRSGVEFGPARNFLQKLINDHGAGQTLDALITCLIDQPTEPKGYIRAVLAKQGAEIPKDWQPPPPCLSEIAALGVPENIFQQARDVFVIWFREQGIRHNNFPALFVRWCQRDWERAEHNRGAYLQRLRAVAGFQEEFREPA
jgi:DnaT DNA-binding domain